MKKLFFAALILIVGFVVAINLNAMNKNTETEKTGKKLEPFIATDEEEIYSSESIRELETQKEEQDYSLDLENIEAGETPDQEELGSADDF